MAISKKGSRIIKLNDEVYLYKISKIKKKSDWRISENELNENFIKIANYYGLGQVKDITINIVVQLKENPSSSFFIKINTILVDGFMGPEQITQIKPQLIKQLINKGLSDGWNPNEKGDFRLNILEAQTKDKEPILLQFPNQTPPTIDYKNIHQLKEIKIGRYPED